LHNALEHGKGFHAARDSWEGFFPFHTYESPGGKVVLPEVVLPSPDALSPRNDSTFLKSKFYNRSLLLQYVRNFFDWRCLFPGVSECVGFPCDGLY